MLGERDFVPVAEGLIAGTAAEPRLIGSQCERCGTVTFPRQGSCPRCTSEDVRERLLARAARCGPGRSSASSPSRRPTRAGEDFEPYAVGYVELPGEVRVETRLTESDPEELEIGMPMELTLIPAPGDSGALTFAFRRGPA